MFHNFGKFLDCSPNVVEERGWGGGGGSSMLEEVKVRPKQMYFQQLNQ